MPTAQRQQVLPKSPALHLLVRKNNGHGWVTPLRAVLRKVVELNCIRFDEAHYYNIILRLSGVSRRSLKVRRLCAKGHAFYALSRQKANRRNCYVIETNAAVIINIVFVRNYLRKLSAVLKCVESWIMLECGFRRVCGVLPLGPFSRLIE